MSVVSGMQSAPIPDNELCRLAALKSLQVLTQGCGKYKMFEDIVRLTVQSISVPCAAVSFLDADTQWLVVSKGTSMSRIPRNISFCSHAVYSGQLLVVEDASQSRSFYNNPLVIEKPHIRFYAGIPLKVPGGLALGTLSLWDYHERSLSADERQTLSYLKSLLEESIRCLYQASANFQYIRSLKPEHATSSQRNYVYHAINRIDSSTVASLTEVQLRSITQALEVSAPFQGHSVHVKGVIPLFFRKYYFVLLMGRDRRQRTRVKETHRVKNFCILATAGLLYTLFSLCLPLLFIIIIVLKHVFGIDVMPGFGIEDFLDNWWE